MVYAGDMIGRVAIKTLKRAKREALAVASGADANWRRRRMLREIARFPAPRKLNLGCGKVHFDGWVNVDEDERLDTVDLTWDLRLGIPSGGADCSYIYCEHLLEHLTASQGLSFLSGCREALRSGGVLRIAMPSLDFILERAVSADWRDQDWLSWPQYQSVKTRAEMLNIAFRSWGHQYLYDREELHRRLAEAGFGKIVDVQPGQSEHAELRNRETRPDSRLVCEASV